jgi:hypothetical protein
VQQHAIRAQHGSDIVMEMIPFAPALPRAHRNYELETKNLYRATAIVMLRNVNKNG